MFWSIINLQALNLKSWESIKFSWNYCIRVTSKYKNIYLFMYSIDKFISIPFAITSPSWQGKKEVKTFTDKLNYINK